MKRVQLGDTGYEIYEERLSSLCKLFVKGDKHHFAQVFVQAGLTGECFIKGLESPGLPFKERKLLHKEMWSYIHNVMGFEYRASERIKDANSGTKVTNRKSLGRYKK